MAFQASLRTHRLARRHRADRGRTLSGRPAVGVAHTTDETTVEELSYTYSFANGAPHPRRRGADAVSEVRRVLAVEGGHDRSGHLRSGLRALRLLHQRRPARARQLGRRSAPSPSTSSTSTRSSARRVCNRQRLAHGRRWVWKRRPRHRPDGDSKLTAATRKSSRLGHGVWLARLAIRCPTPTMISLARST